jgi:hypothetical protein
MESGGRSCLIQIWQWPGADLVCLLGGKPKQTQDIFGDLVGCHSVVALGLDPLAVLNAAEYFSPVVA